MRRYLVFVRVGAKSLHRGWHQPGAPRNWDLQLSQYDDDPEIGRGGDLPLSVDKGKKWDSVYRFLRDNPSLFQRYRYMAFMDDDLVFEPGVLDRYFELCEQHDLLVAQPSLHPDSYVCYPILMTCPFTRLRYTNFVECMAAAIRTDYLQEFLPRMANVRSGWGMDHIWTVSMKEPAFRSAVIDEVSMVHTRPHATGGIYKQFASDGVDPQTELQETLARYVGVPDKMMTYGAVLRSGRRVGGVAARCLNGASLIMTAPRARDQRRTLRTGAGMFVRALTHAKYQPAAILEAAPSGASA